MVVSSHPYGAQRSLSREAQRMEHDEAPPPPPPPLLLLLLLLPVPCSRMEVTCGSFAPAAEMSREGGGLFCRRKKRSTSLEE